MLGGTLAKMMGFDSSTKFAPVAPTGEVLPV
jgi:hypothetical protein